MHVCSKLRWIFTADAKGERSGAQLRSFRSAVRRIPSAFAALTNGLSISPAPMQSYGIFSYVVHVHDISAGPVSVPLRLNAPLDALKEEDQGKRSLVVKTPAPEENENHAQRNSASEMSFFFSLAVTHALRDAHLHVSFGSWNRIIARAFGGENTLSSVVGRSTLTVAIFSPVFLFLLRSEMKKENGPPLGSLFALITLTWILY